MRVNMNKTNVMVSGEQQKVTQKVVDQRKPGQRLRKKTVMHLS